MSPSSAASLASLRAALDRLAAAIEAMVGAQAPGKEKSAPAAVPAGAR